MNIFAKISLFLIRMYQIAISPFLQQRCRFTPSCSHYAVEAIHQHGFFWGAFFSFKRICRCHPWHPGGYDPIP